MKKLSAAVTPKGKLFRRIRVQKNSLNQAILKDMTDKVAVILSGSGVFDGSEVHETSAACVALSRAGKEVVVSISPDFGHVIYLIIWIFV